MTYNQYLAEIDLEDAESIERLVDKFGIAAVLNLITVICGAKAEHIAVNWQDTGLAKRWDTVANQLGHAQAAARGL